MKRWTHTGLLLAAGVLAALLCACAAPGGGNTPASGADPESPQTIQGTLNQLDTDQSYLVLVTDDAYCRFDFSESGADLSGFEPGDAVAIPYPATLGEASEDVTADLVHIEKK